MLRACKCSSDKKRVINTGLLFCLLTKEFGGVYQDDERKRIAITSARTVQKNSTERMQTKIERAQQQLKLTLK